MKLLSCISMVWLLSVAGTASTTDCPPTYTFTGQAAYGYFGVSVSGAGDVNNDGHDDLIVGAHFYGSVDTGKAYVYSGQSGTLLRTFTGGNLGDYFGASVSGAGDVNNDGYDDLIVGAQFDKAAGIKAGRAFVYSGLNGSLLYTFTAPGPFHYFGVSVSGAGDVNNDGYDDLIVGAAGANRAYVYSGENGALLDTLIGLAENFGGSVSCAGDVDNDGYDDLIVGADENDVGGSNAGRAYVYSGHGDSLIHIFTGAVAGDYFGGSVSGAGDVSGDGYDDLIVGARYGGNTGQAYVYSGHTGTLLFSYSGQATYDSFGRSVSGAGDVNNDGYVDLIVGASSNDAGGEDAGRAYVYTCKLICGDIDNNGSVDPGDLSYLVDYLFRGGPPPPVPWAADVNGSGGVDVSDMTYLIEYFFSGGPEPICQ